MNSAEPEKALQSIDVESLVATVSFRTSESAQLETLLPHLTFASELLNNAPAITEPSLIYRGRDGRVHVRAIGEGISMGRSDDCEIPFPGLREVSRHHFRVALEKDEYVLTDAGSSNGTFIRGDKERMAKHILRDGDIIEAAGFEFVFVKE